MNDLGKIHHLAYVVDDIPAAAQKLNEQFGAGPFFAIDVVPVEDVTSRASPPSSSTPRPSGSATACRSS